MIDATPAVVLLSGGLDSSVLLHHVVRGLGRAPVHALSFDYGQRHRRELVCARAQAQAAGAVAHEVIDMAFLGPLLRGGSALIEGGAPVPNLSDLDSGALRQPPTYVPNRNMLLLSLAAAYAEVHGIQDLYYGAQAQDEYGYWDCTREFLDRMNATLALNRAKPVRVHAPFVGHPKAQSVRLGLQLGVDFSQTWSCYQGGETACGACPTCVERLNAFAAAGVADPLPYR
jgi:7-cyano-7-deazaguanine synthase